MWFSLPEHARALGRRRAARGRRGRRARRSPAIGEFCEAQGVDAWFRRGGYLQVSTAPAQDGVWTEAVDACRELELEALRAARRRAASPPAAPRPPSAAAPSTRTRRRCSRRGWRSGCASRLLAAGVEIFERSPVARRLRAARRTASRRGQRRRGSCRRRGPRDRRRRRRAGAAPLRNRLTVTSSHIVLTEPVPELLEEIGWTGGECITDCRALINYFRTTPDGRIAFGWGGGRIAMGARAARPRRARRPRSSPMAPSTCGLLPRPSRARPSPTPGAARSTPRRPTCRWSCRCAAAAPSPPPATPATASAPRTWSAAPSPLWPWTAATTRHGSPSSTPRHPRVPPEPFHWLGGEAIRMRDHAQGESRASGPRPRPNQHRDRQGPRTDRLPHRPLTLPLFLSPTIAAGTAERLVGMAAYALDRADTQNAGLISPAFEGEGVPRLPYHRLVTTFLRV